MIPELRTSGRFAISLAVLALIALAIAVLAGSRVEKGLGSDPAGLVVVVLWCVTGVGAAIAAIVDAYLRPEGEQLGLAATIAATIFGMLTLVVLAAIIYGGLGGVELLEEGA